MKTFTILIIAAAAGILGSCGTTLPPAELINARQAYQKASTGQAAQLVPAELHKAQEALALAEKAFQDDPKSFQARDLAYIADRKAKIAEALAVTANENAAKLKAEKEYQAAQTDIMKKSKEDLAASERANAQKAEQLKEAEKRTADMQAQLAKLASVKDDARGTVVTLSGSVLFASNKSVLLPAAKTRLNQVADALMATKERKLTVEGYTDSQGSDSHNLTLSQKRADAVRDYIVSRGYPGDMIQSQGIGKENPIADNANAEGRANNRRVEIIIEHAEAK